MESSAQTVLASIVAAALGAIATLGAAYMSKSDFNPTHQNEISQTDSCADTFDAAAFDQVQATLTTFNRNDTVSYSQCRMSYDSTIPRLMCTADQVFNDRKVGGQPFDPTKKDSLGIALVKQDQKVKMVLTLKTWGNTDTTIWPVCKGRFMIGSALAGEDVYVVHLTRN